MVAIARCKNLCVAPRCVPIGTSGHRDDWSVINPTQRLAKDTLMAANQFAVVTGASTGIGLELARCCARGGFDLAHRGGRARDRAAAPRCSAGSAPTSRRSRPISPPPKASTSSTPRPSGRPVDALLANAGRGLGKAFLDQDFAGIRHVIDTNVTGTLVSDPPRRQRHAPPQRGRILITGSIAGFMPGSFQAVYNAQQGVSRLVLVRAARGAEGQRRHRDLPDAGRDGNRVLRARRHDGHQGRHRRRRTMPPTSRRPASTR